MSEKQELTVKEQSMLATQTDAPLGFEDEEAGDMIIPRIKVVQTLSPERKDKKAEEGDIINSLTLEKCNGKVFIPVFRYNNNIDWIDRSEGGGMRCIARDAKVGETQDGTRMLCAQCRKCEFDNSKQGKEAFPTCTKYINFFGFFAGERTPIILSFAKTNYSEGKKLYSLAKVTMQNMWNFGYKLDEKIMAKNNNEWYIIVASPAGPTSDEDREFAMGLYTSFRNTIASVSVDFSAENEGSSPAPVADVDSTEF